MGVTIKDVAAAAGTSVSTVSKVISGRYSISDATCARIKKVMKELNYSPNITAQNFARGSTHTVVFLASLERNVAFSNPHMFEILAGAEATLKKHGFKVNICSTDRTQVCEVVEGIISQHAADGVIIHASVLSRPVAALLTKKNFPHIVLGLPSFTSQVCWIDINNVFSGVTAVTHLIKQGYEKIAYIGGWEYDMISSRRLEGVKQGLSNAGYSIDEQYIWLGDSTSQEGYRMAKQLLSLRDIPDAIICANNHIALGCVNAIKEMNLRIPRDIGVITFDNYPFSEITNPKLTVVDIDVRNMGKEAGRLLLDYMKNTTFQVQTYTTKSSLIVRESTQRIK